MALTPQEQEQLKQASAQLGQMETTAKSLLASRTGARTTTTPTTTPVVPSTGVDTTVAGAVADRLRQNIDIVSSIPTPTEISLAGERAKIEEAGVSFETGVRASIERKRIEIEEESARTLASAREMQRGAGPASAFALIDRINKSTEASMRDLDLREQEALATNKRDIADRIANLKLQELTFNQSARQQAFNQAIGIANLGIQMAQEKRLENQAKTVEQQAMSAIALNYGVTVEPGDTIESITSRAAPFASDKQKLELDRIKADIGKIKAETQKTISESGATAQGASLVDFLAGNLESMGDPATRTGAILDIQKQFGGDVANLVSSRLSERMQPRTWTKEELLSTFTANKSQKTYQQALEDINLDTRIQNKEDAKEIVNQIYGRGKIGGGLFRKPEITPIKPQPVTGIMSPATLPTAPLARLQVLEKERKERSRQIRRAEAEKTKKQVEEFFSGLRR